MRYTPSKYYLGEKFLIQINKQEAEMIRKRCPATHIAVTNKQGPSRKKQWYMEEASFALKMLNRLRKQGGAPR